MSAYVKTRTREQTTSHAQKYLPKLVQKGLVVNKTAKPDHKKSAKKGTTTTAKKTRSHFIMPSSSNTSKYTIISPYKSGSIARATAKHWKSFDPNELKKTISTLSSYNPTVVITPDHRHTVKEKTNTGQWTSEEHERFVSAYHMYGKDWKKVASIVNTRSIVQTRTHAQKFMLNTGVVKKHRATIGSSSDKKVVTSNNNPVNKAVSYSRKPSVRAEKKKAEPKKKVRSKESQGRGDWLERDHKRFIDGCITYGWGNWKVLSKLFRGKSTFQVARHAHAKYIREKKKELISKHQEVKEFNRSVGRVRRMFDVNDNILRP